MRVKESNDGAKFAEEKMTANDDRSVIKTDLPKGVDRHLFV